MRGEATGKLIAFSAARRDSAGEFGFVLRHEVVCGQRIPSGI